MIINNHNIFSMGFEGRVADQVPVFDEDGCDNCGNGIGKKVFKCYATLKDSFKKELNKSDYLHNIKLCENCLGFYQGGEPLSDDCKDVFGMKAVEEKVNV